MEKLKNIAEEILSDVNDKILKEIKTDEKGLVGITKTDKKS